MMKKSLLSALFLLLLGVIPAAYSYSPLSEQDHRQIDRQLEDFRSLSSAEKKEKSDFFSRLAQKSLLIRKAFSPHLKTKIYGAKLTSEDQLAVKRRISALQLTTEARRNEALALLETTQYLAQELARSLQIESTSTFEGYAKTTMPTPLFWLPIDEANISVLLGAGGATGLKLDKQNLIRELAVVLPEGEVVTLLKKVQTGDFTTYQVRTREFDAGLGAKYGYFLDARFIEKADSKPKERIAQLPPLAHIQKNLTQASGSAYIWGGAYWQGLPYMEKFFPSAVPLSSAHFTQKTLKGVDCSGLLYQATDGYTPRNTRQLLYFGDAVAISGASLSQMVEKLKPLDLVVWAGHVVIVLNEKQAIESRWRANFQGGVEIVDLKTRLEEIMKTRTGVDDYFESPLAEHKKFVVRRWFS